MAAELQPPVSPVINPPPQPPPPSLPPAPTPDNQPPSLAPKRHRRPSVRLGDIGDPPATLRTTKPWRLSPNPIKSSKTRPLTNLVTAANGTFNPNPNFTAETPFSTTANGTSNRKLSKDFKSRRLTSGAKRPRIANFRIDDVGDDDRDIEDEKDNDFRYDDDGDEEGFKDFDPEGSEPELEPEPEPEPEPHSPLHSTDDMAHLDAWHGHNRRSIRGFSAVAATRVSDSRPEIGLDGLPETDSRNRGGSGTGLDNGVRNWLMRLGLGRYAPVFEFHEVDEDVLPHLTLEDLKDMSIIAVGSRRKLYLAIQKLRNGLS